MAKRFFWIRGEDLRKAGFFDMVAQMGADQMRLEVHPGDPEPLRWVEEKSGEVCGSYNESHDCPIDCP